MLALIYNDSYKYRGSYIAGGRAGSTGIRTGLRSTAVRSADTPRMLLC